ncbi:MAG: hypothetical protein JHC95_12490 [Solirubrobacteraceae bacterium]|nr:hypothetical protein [Solirubrobacteraceae bacterium]
MTDPIVPINRNLGSPPVDPLQKVHRQTDEEREEERQRRRKQREEDAEKERTGHATPPDDEGHQHIDVQA